MNPLTPLRVSLSIGLMLATVLAHAAHGQNDHARTTFSGFGTLGYVHDDSSHHAFTRDLAQSIDVSSNSTWKADTRLGLQLVHTVGPTLEFVGQLVIRDQAQASLDRSIEWAFVGYRPTSELNLRAGRVGVDVFLMSDSRHIGYSYPWVRPPMEAYAWMPLYYLEGGDITWQKDGLDATWRVKAQAGKGRMRIPFFNRILNFETKAFWDATVSRETGPLTLKAGYAGFRAAKQGPIEELLAGLDSVAGAGLGPFSDEAAQLRGDVSFKDARIGYSSIGAAYDDGVWLLQSELSNVTGSTAIVPRGQRAYVSVGRRFGAWTPYVLLATSRSPGARTAVNDWSPLGPAAALQAGAIGAINATRIAQKTVALGVRWDFHNSAALKVQWDSVRGESNGWALWSKDREFEAARVNLLSTTLDFSF